MKAFVTAGFRIKISISEDVSVGKNTKAEEKKNTKAEGKKKKCFVVWE